MTDPIFKRTADKLREESDSDAVIVIAVRKGMTTVMFSGVSSYMENATRAFMDGGLHDWMLRELELASAATYDRRKGIDHE